MHYLRGMVYSKRKEWQAALDNLSKAAKLEPENRTYVNTLGHALARAGRTEEALQVFLRVNTEGVAYYNLARMMQHLNQPEMSRQYAADSRLQKEPRLARGRRQTAVASSTGGNADGRPADLGHVGRGQRCRVGADSMIVAATTSPSQDEDAKASSFAFLLPFRARGAL